MGFLDSLTPEAREAFIRKANVSPVGNPDLIASWEQGVRKLATGVDPGPDEYSAIVWTRAVIDKASGALSSEDKRRLKTELATIDGRFRELTVEDTTEILSEFMAVDRQKWYWKRIPKFSYVHTWSSC